MEPLAFLKGLFRGAQPSIMSKMVVTVSGTRGGTWRQTLGHPIPAAELKGLILQCNQAEFAVVETKPMSRQLRLLKLLLYLGGLVCIYVLFSYNYRAVVAYFFGEPQSPLWNKMEVFVSLLQSLLIVELLIAKLDEALICEKIVLIPKLGIQCETIRYTRSLWALIRSLWLDSDPPALEREIWESGFGSAYSQKRFYPLDHVLDIVINECFKGFQVVFVMQMLVKNDSKEKDFDISLVFPELLPRREFLETVWRSTRELLEEANI